ncbi:MAG: hypothetical protein KGJ58_03975 [Patescibacteria group bacterium]|nr:hypothetical protein [Patescibacteria group bacterium]MDE1988658.1 hypothetical protein [Patescibacteria group bacterium]MDE2218579.1 hypothetical protein [Patescibacteria group bacterium]
MRKENCPMSKEDIVFDLKKGLEAEYRAMALCEKLMPLIYHELDKKDIAGIIADEKEHIEITNKLIEIVNKYYTLQK